MLGVFVLFLFTLIVSCLVSFPSSASAAGEFITTWQTDNDGISNDDQITIPTASGPTYNYTVDWGDASSNSGVTGNITHTYAAPGTYTVTISGTFPQIFFESGNTSDAHKLLTIEQWGNIHWTSMYKAFAGCSNLEINAVDAPDLSAVTDMEYMFLNDINLNSDLSNWDVSNVTNMYGMFQSNLLLNQSFNSWDVSNVGDFGYMFDNDPSFNGDITDWDTSSAYSMDLMFAGATAFNQDISGWDVSGVTSMGAMFNQATHFDQDLSDWDVSNVTNMSGMFYFALAFENGGQPLDWDVGNVTNMSSLFHFTSFNEDITGWDTSSATDMSSMFNANDDFNQDISAWDTSNVTNMNLMFYGANSFNQDISGWDVGNVTNMSGMFYLDGVFNQDLGDWEVSNVTNMSYMFSDAASFNQDLSDWDVYHVTNMDTMFGNATLFDQDLSTWDVSEVTNMAGMFTNVTLSTEHYDAMLSAWADLHLRSNVVFDGGDSQYCSSKKDREKLHERYDWNITDGGILRNNCGRSSSGGGSSRNTLVPLPKDETPAPLAPETNPIPPAYQFMRDLKQGMKGDDVKALQEFLIKQNLGPSASSLLKVGATGYFGRLTKQALIEYQKSKNITPSLGYFGPKTRASVGA